MLKFLADVNIEKQIVDFLREKGYDIKWIPDYDTTMPDEELLEMALREERILVTNDKDFGELMFLQNKLSKGIVLFRIKGQDIQIKLKSIDILLQRYYNKLLGNFIVITKRKIRVTTPEKL